MKAETFLTSWSQAYHARREPILAAWDSRKAYTCEMVNVLSDIASENGLQMNTEYYSTDAVLFRDEDAHQDGRALYVINPTVLFEHENDSDSITDEIAHHLLLDADLHVTVGYFYDRVNDNYLEYLRGIINKSRKAATLKEKRSFLIILGSDDEWLENGYWRGFLYQGDHWEELNP